MAKPVEILCVAPLREADPYRTRDRNVFEGLGLDTGFESRDAAVAEVTRPVLIREGLHTPSRDAIEVRDAKLYEHTGMRFLVATLVLASTELLSNTNIVAFEQETTKIFEELCAAEYDDTVRVRWVNRTLFVNDLAEVPQRWFQKDGAKATEIGTKRTFYGNWGNNVLVHTPDADLSQFDLADPIVHAQYLWCYLTDIERISLGYLSMVNSGKRVKDELVSGVIDLHFELAMESVLRERTRTESQPWYRDVVDAILTSWEYETVHEDVDRRLSRLEHIVQARSELFDRSQSRIMEITLFVLGALTLVSLAISLVQTAFAEISADEDALRPSGGLFELMRQFDASALVWWSLALSIVIILAARLVPGVRNRNLKEGRDVRAGRRAQGRR